MAKIGLVGFGGIGMELAKALVQEPSLTCDLVAFDIPEVLEKVPGPQRGLYAEILDAIGILGGADTLKLTSDTKDLAGSEVIIFTAGLPRRADQDRADLIGVNAKIVQPICRALKTDAQGSFVIMVTNPLDAMVELAYRTLRFPATHVVGQAGVLDTGRMNIQVSLKTGIPCRQISTLVLGGHGPTMVPVFSQAVAAGKPVTSLLSEEDLKDVSAQVADRGRTIIKQQGRSAVYSTAIACVKMAQAYLLDQKVILAACARLNGEYGHRDVFAGVPVEISAAGARVVEVPLAENEKALLDRSVVAVREETGLLEKVLAS